MATVKATAGLGKLDWKDILEGLKMAAIIPALTIIYTSIDAGSFDINWNLVWKTAILGAVGYIIKKITTPSKLVVTDATKETIEGVKDGSIDAKMITH